jgi:hypothetical protein
MTLTFKDPAPPDPALAALRERADTVMQRLANDLAAILGEIAAHPRYNEKADRARDLLDLLETMGDAAVGLKKALGEQPVLDRLDVIVASVARAADMARALAEENALHPASVIGKLPVNEF